MAMYDTGLQSADEVKNAELKGQYVPRKFGAETDRLGREYVGVMPILEWAKHEAEADFLLEKCESLHKSFSALRATPFKTNGHVI